MPKVRSLIKKAWHLKGSILKGEIGEVSDNDAKILLARGQVELVAEKVRPPAPVEVEANGDEPAAQPPPKRGRKAKAE